MSDDRVVIITGAGRNIGKATAELLASEGWVVAACDLDLEAARETAHKIEADGGRAAAFACDVSDEDQVTDMVGQVARELGTAVGLVNNVGITANNTMANTSLDEWNRTLAGCVTSSFLCLREVTRRMVDEGLTGAAVNIASTTAHRGNRGKVAYGVAKAGVLNLTRMAAMELAPNGIRVNTVTPALTGSPVGKDDSQVRDGVPPNIPLGRWGEPLDQANATAFLLSDKAAFITGAELVVDGGVLASYPKSW